MSMPAVVNAAFSLELFLKALNIEWKVKELEQVQDGEKAFISRYARKKGHTPSELYLALDERSRDVIERAFQASALGQRSRSFAALLEDFDDLFEQWRYVYEGR